MKISRFANFHKPVKFRRLRNFSYVALFSLPMNSATQEKFRKKKKKANEVFQMKKKKKKKKDRNVATLCLETRAWSEGYTMKVFKAWCPKPTG